MRFLARFLGFMLLAGAFAAAVLDGARWVANGDFAPTSMKAALGSLSPRTIANLQNVVQARLGAKAWDEFAHALSAPLFLYLTALSALLFVLSRGRRREPDW